MLSACKQSLSLGRYSAAMEEPDALAEDMIRSFSKDH